MDKRGNRISARLVSLLLAAVLIIGMVPLTVFAKEADAGSGAAAAVAESCTVIAHGGTIETKQGEPAGETAACGTVLQITLDEAAFAGHTFVCWRGDDGTEIPQKSFRLLVERSCAFYPIFSDLKGSFGDWRVAVRGEFCDDGTLYVREDTATGLKEYIFREEAHDYRYENVGDGMHRVTCANCPFTETTEHNWNGGKVTLEATHTENGEKTYTCSGCGATKTEAIPANTDDHFYPAYPVDSDWVVITEPDGMTPGTRRLKCRNCDEMMEPEEFITSSLPQKNVKIEFEYISTGSHSGKELHYIGEDCYYFFVDRYKSPYSFGFLYFDEGENSPVYIRSVATSVERYGDAGGTQWGILCYVDSYEEFVSVITNFNNGIYVGDNGIDVAILYSTASGIRSFEGRYNEIASNGVPDTLQLTGENITSDKYPGKTFRTYKYTGGYSPVEYLVDENNACFSVFTNEADKAQIISMEPLEDFPFEKPDRNEITWYSYYVNSGGYPNDSYDSNYFNMTHMDPNDEKLAATPRAASSGMVFSHWEKYDPYTWEWEFYSSDYTVYPDSADVTTLRAVYKDLTYHIKVNGGYYQLGTGSSWSFGDEKYTEGDVKAGKTIRLGFDPKQVPEGKEFDAFTDAAGNRLDYSTFTPDADGEYTATYTDETLYLNAYAENGIVYKNGEEFSWEKIRIGDSITLTTESASEEYPYFLGWYLDMNTTMGSVHELLSTDTTLTFTVPEADSININAYWHSAPEIANNQFTVNAANGFLRMGGGSLTVSDLLVSNDEYIVATKDPSNPLVIKSWHLTGTLDNGEACDIEVDYDEPDTWIWLMNETADGGKGDGKGDGKGGEQSYPWNITVTGVANVCAEHDWDDGVVTKQPTHKDYGEMTYTCWVCGTQKTEAIPMIPRYCVHACESCGKCTLAADDPACDYIRCTCGSHSALPTQNGPVIDFSSGSGKVYTVLHEEQPDNPYVQYVLAAAEGYDVEKIYDISYDGTDKENVTVTLTVGTAYAQEIADGRMYIIHVADEGNVLYGVGTGYLPVEVNTQAGTVAFTVSSFSPFVLVRNAVAYYGRAALAALPNSTALLAAYDKIVAGIDASKAEITLYDGANTITEAELATVFDAYRRDHTEHFWVENGYSYSKNGAGTVITILPTYTMSGTALAAAKERFNAAAAELMSGITGAMSEYEREKTLHDRLAAQVSYESADNAHNAYGALVEGKAVCEGYAEAYQYLLQLAGLQSFIAIGSSENPATGEQEGHAWNIVRVDGSYYHVDLTWDDQGENLFYAYFNKTDAAITEDHAVETAAYALPVCNAGAADYFTVNGGKMESFDAAAVGTMLKNAGGMARVYVTGDKTAFIEAFEANIQAVAQNAGISGGFTYSYMNLGREYILKIGKTGCTVSGTLTSFGGSDNVTVKLIKNGETEPAYEVNVAGSGTSYSIENVAPGTYTMTVAKKNHVTRAYTVTVSDGNVTQAAEIWLLGDVTGDGEVNIGDHQRLFEHLQGIATITDPYQLLIADINADGTINIGDHQRLFEHLQGIASLYS